MIFNKEYKPKVYTPPKSARRPEGYKVQQEVTETKGLCGRKTPITKLSIAPDSNIVDDDEVREWRLSLHIIEI